MLSRPLFFISLWFRHRIEELLGLNFGLGVVSMIETWCSYCIGVVSTSYYPILSTLAMYIRLICHVNEPKLYCLQGWTIWGNSKSRQHKYNSYTMFLSLTQHQDQSLILIILRRRNQSEMKKNGRDNTNTKVKSNY